MVHLSKLCVGVRDVAQLRAWQEQRIGSDPPLRHMTRNMPRRAEEVVAGGSLYWVLAGVMLVRQRVVAIRPDRWDDGTACAGLHLDPALIPVEPRVVRAFQGWRYLLPADAPPDVDPNNPAPDLGMPEQLRADLRRLALL